MTLICDAAPLVALADREDPERARILEILRSEPGSLVIPAQVSARSTICWASDSAPQARRPR